MNIRRHKVGEEDEIRKLYCDTTRNINGKDYTQAQVERWIQRAMGDETWNERVKQKNPFVAEEGGKIVGFGELDADGHIDKFYCHHEWQRKGVGRLLYGAIEEEARRTGIGRLYLESSVTAKDFFASRGFQVVEEENNLICGAIAKRYRMQKMIS
jgi:N-acetylglutamate synthase-like GNAT family acetyltransferase